MTIHTFVADIVDRIPAMAKDGADNNRRMLENLTRQFIEDLILQRIAEDECRREIAEKIEQPIEITGAYEHDYKIEITDQDGSNPRFMQCGENGTWFGSMTTAHMLVEERRRIYRHVNYRIVKV